MTKSLSANLLKITTKENCLITNHFLSIINQKKNHHVKQNQSKKINSWKYALVLPALVAFVFLFQVKVIAQGKESEFKISNAPITVSMLRRHNKIEKEFFKRLME
jgi:hypothetical protein